MKVFAAATILSLGAAAIAAPTLSERQFSLNYTTTLLNDIANIASSLNQLNNDVNAFTGGPSQAFQALAIQGDALNVQNNLNQANKDAMAASQFNDLASAAIASAVTALQPNIYNILSQLITKKPGFETVIFGSSAVPIVNSSIISLQSSTNNFGGNLTAKFSPEFQLLAPLITGDIAFHFDRAAEDYYNP